MKKTTKEPGSLVPKYGATYWHKEIKRAQEARSTFYDRSVESIKMYSAEKNAEGADRRMSIWWSIVETLLPAFYSKLPKTEASLRKRTGAPIYQVAAVGIERFTQYAIEDFFDFHTIAYRAVQQALLTGEAALWPSYNPVLEDEEYEYYVEERDGVLYDSNGQPFKGDSSSVREDNGRLIVKEPIPTKKGESVTLECVHFRDFLCSPARCEDEIYWKAKRAFMTREEVKAMFDEDISRRLDYTVVPEDLKREKREASAPEGKAELWEIWCEGTGKKYYVSDKGNESICEPETPAISFIDFYPSSEIRFNTNPNTIVPTSMYVHCRDQVMEVERLTSRIHAMTQGMRVNGVYDATLGTVVESLMTSDLKLNPVQKWPNYKAKGGLSNSIEFLNIDSMVNALQVLMTSRERALEKLYETIAASDLIRGATAPMETATAQTLKANFTNLRHSVGMKKFERFFSQAISKVGEIMCQKFDIETLGEIADGDELASKLPPIATPDGQQIPVPWEEIANVIKSEYRRYRVEISTDSMTTLNESDERQQMTDMMASAGSFIGQLEPMVKEHPAIAPWAFQMMQAVMRTYRRGKEMEGAFQGVLKAITDKAIQAQSQQKPDPKQQEIDAKLQIAEVEAMTEQKRLTLQIQETAQNLQMKQLEMQANMQIEQGRLAIEQTRLSLEKFKAESEATIRVEELKIKAQQVEGAIAKDLIKAEIDDQMNDFNKVIESERLELEKRTVMLSEYEKLLEEKRLSLQNLGKTSESVLPPINIQVDATKSSKRRARILRDEAGNATLELDGE